MACSAAQISCLFPFAKAAASPRASRPRKRGGKKITARSAKCGRCFSRISWPGECCLSPPECKTKHPLLSPWRPGLSCALDGWLGILHLIKDAAVLCENKTKTAPLNLRPAALALPARNCHCGVQTLSSPRGRKIVPCFTANPSWKPAEKQGLMTSSTYTQNNILGTFLFRQVDYSSED